MRAWCMHTWCMCVCYIWCSVYHRLLLVSICLLKQGLHVVLTHLIDVHNLTHILVV